MRLDDLLGGHPRRGPAGAAPRDAAAPHAPPGVMALPHPDWLYHELSVAGDADDLWEFRRAAAGAGVTPWVHDYDALEEHWLALMLLQPGRTISLQGARIVARQVRDAFQEEHEEACAWVGRSQACPLDLHALCPVPWEVLRLGPDAPASMRWLWEHWGTTWSLRRVERLPGEAWRVGFWSADWSPWPVVAACRARWPRLRFGLRVAYGTTGDGEEGAPRPGRRRRRPR